MRQADHIQKKAVRISAQASRMPELEIMATVEATADNPVRAAAACTRDRR
jgi:hypothetical protein